MYYFVWQTSSPMHQLYSHALALAHEQAPRPRARSVSRPRSRAPSTSARPQPVQDKLAQAGSSSSNNKRPRRSRQQPPPNQPPPPSASGSANRPRRRGQKQHAQQSQGAFRVYRDRAPAPAPAPIPTTKQQPPPAASKQWSAADVPPGLEPLLVKSKPTPAKLDVAPPPTPRVPLAPLPQGRPRANSFYLPKPPGAPAGIPPAAFRRPRALSSPTSPVFRTPATTGAALAQAEAAVLREGRCRLVAGLLLNRVRARPLCPARRLLCYAAPRPYVPSSLSSEVSV